MSADHYVTQTGSYVMGDSDHTENVDLVAVQYTFTINPTPADATVIIDGQIRSSISAPFGTNIPWSVARTGYASQSGVYTVIDDHTENVTLVANQYTFTIVPTPADAYVEINGEPRTSITTAYGTSISWEVSKSGYVTQSNTETLTGDTTRNVTLVENQYTFTIVPTPADATVMINGVEQSSVTVSDGTTLTWEVSKTGYTTQTGSYTIDGADHTENVTLVSTQAVITFNKGNSAVKLVVNGEYLGTSSSTHTVTVDPGTPIHWEAYRAGYATKKGDFVAQSGASTVSTSLSTAKFVRGTATSSPTLNYYSGSYKVFNITYNSPNFYSSETTIGSGAINDGFANAVNLQKLETVKFEACQSGKFGEVNYPFKNSQATFSQAQAPIDSVSWDGAAPSGGMTFRGLNNYNFEDTSGTLGQASLRRASIPIVYINNCDFSNLTTSQWTQLIEPTYVYAYTGSIDDYPNRTKEIHMNCWDNVPASVAIYPIHTTYRTGTGATSYVVNRTMAYNYIKNADIDVYAYGWSSTNIETLKSYFKIHTYSASLGGTIYQYGIDGIGIIRIWIDETHYWYWSLVDEYSDINYLWNNASYGGSGTFNCTQWSLISIPENRLKFNVVTGGDITWNAKTDVDASKKTINYSKNGGSWTPITAAYGTPATISVNAGDVVEFYGSNSNYGDGTDGAYFGSANGATFSASGDITSLIDSSAIVDGVLPDNAFRGLFDGCTGLVSGVSKMTFGSDVTGMGDSSCRYMFPGCTGLTTIPFNSLDYTLGGSCFRDMFKNCTNLAETPVLSQTTLADSCYYSMLYGCSSITTAPTLPATTLASSCYREMLRGTSITTAPALPATTLAAYCYQSMFNSCYDMTTGPASLPATTLAANCYAYMFENCQYMTTTPTMPTVTSIPTYAYRAMFKNCYRITSAPVLNVQSIATYGCYGMFQGCVGLTSVTGTLKATANYAYQYMFDGCTNITTVPEITYTGTVSGTTSNGAFVRMFQNCSSLQRIKCLTATGGGNPFNYWVSGVAATGTFVKNGTVNWSTGVNYCPSGWTQEFEHYNFTGTATSSPTLYVNRTSDSSGGTGMGAIEYDTDTKQFRTRIPATVTSLRGMAYNNSALTSIDMSNGYPLAYIDQTMFYNCANLTSINLPDDITSVKTSAFGNCAALTSIEFPDSVNEIVYDSLFGCTGLTSITVNSINPPKLAAAFPYVNATIYVPAESVNAYKNATGDYVGWSTMASQIQPIP